MATALPIPSGVPLTVLVKQLMDGGFLWVEEQCGHVVVGPVGTEELADRRVDVVAAPHLQRSKITHTRKPTATAAAAARRLGV